MADLGRPVRPRRSSIPEIQAQIDAQLEAFASDSTGGTGVAAAKPAAVAVSGVSAVDAATAAARKNRKSSFTAPAKLMDKALEESAATTLHIGACVAISSIDTDSFLVSEGYMDVRVAVEPRSRLLDSSANCRDFGDCVFQVMAGLQYTALEALESVPVQQITNALEEAAALEARQNTETEHKLAGTEVVYGQAIQLRHVKSNKYLICRPRQLAETERENSRLEIGERQSSNARFMILPRYKHRSEGEPIILSDQVVLKLPDSNAYVHVSDNVQLCATLGMREVNLSTTTTRWSMQLYADFRDLRPQSTALKGGDFVRVFHVESSSYVECDTSYSSQETNPLVDYQPKSVGNSASTNSLWLLEHITPAVGARVKFGQHVRFRHVATGKYAAVLPSDLEAQQIYQAHQQQHHHHGPSPFKHKLNIYVPNATDASDPSDHVVLVSEPNEHTLFVVQPTAGVEPGPVPLVCAGVRIQHVETGTWLQSGSFEASASMAARTFSPMVGDAARRVAAKLAAVEAFESKQNATPDRDDDSESSKGEQPVPSLRKHASWTLMSPKSTQTPSAVLFSPAAAQAGVTHLVAATSENHEDVFRIMLANAVRGRFVPSHVLIHAQVEFRETLALVSVAAPLKWFIQRVKQHATELVAADELHVTRVLSELLWFTVEERAPLPLKVPPLMLDGSPLPHRQRLLCEQHVAELIVQVLTAPFRQWGGPFSLDNIAVEREKIRQSRRNQLNVADQDFARDLTTVAARDSPLIMIQRVCRLCYRVLWFMFRSNPQAALLVAQHMEVFVAQAGYDLGVEHMLSELIKDNVPLLERMTVDQVRGFVQLVRRCGKRAEYLQLLSALCGSADHAVPSKQEMICDMLFGNGDGVLRERLVALSMLGQWHLREQAWSQSISQLLSNGMGDGLDILLLTKEITSDDAERRATGIEVYTGTIPGFETFVAQSAANAVPVPGTTDPLMSAAPKESELRRAHADRVMMLLTRSSLHWVPLRVLCQTSTSTRTDSHAGLAEYFIAMLHLYTKLCYNRNYSCIGLMRRLFSRAALVLVTQDSTLPAKLRCACCALLTVVYVDVRPQTPITVTSRPRFWSQIAAEDSLTSLHPTGVPTTGPEAQFFADLRLFCVTYLESLRTPHPNFLVLGELTLAVLSLAHKLLLFGFFDAQAALARLCAALMPLLERKSETRQVRARTRTSTADFDASIRKVFTPTPSSLGSLTRRSLITVEVACVQECQQVVCDILLFVSELRVHHQLSKLLLVFYELHHFFDEPRHENRRRRHGHFPAFSTHLHMHRDSTFGLPVLTTQTLWQEQRAHLLTAFDAIVKDPELNLANYTNSDLVPVMLDLLLHQHEGLVAAALRLLMLHFSTRSILNSSLKGVQLLVADTDGEVFKCLQVLAPELHQLVESDEVWMTFDSRYDRGLGRRVRYLLELMTDMMWTGFAEHVPPTSEMNLNASHTVDYVDSAASTSQVVLAMEYGPRWRAEAQTRDCVAPARQALMANLGIVNMVSTLIQDAAAVLTTREQLGKEHLPAPFLRAMRKLFDACYSFLVVYMRRNLDHQTHIWTSLPTLRSHVEEGIVTPNIYTAIWMNNPPLCRNVDAGHIHMFIDLIGIRGAVAEFLAPLHAVVVCRGRVISENQLLVGRILLDKLSTVMPIFQVASVYTDRLIAMCARAGAVDTLHKHLVHDGTFGPSWWASIATTDWTKEQGMRTAVAMLEGAEGYRPKTAAALSTVSVQATDDAWAPALELHAITGPHALLYHARLLQLLTKCCAGQNFEMEAMCQALLPLDTIVATLMHKELPLEIRCLLQEFLFEVWLCTERLSLAVADCKRLISMFTMQGEELLAIFDRPPASMLHVLDSHVSDAHFGTALRDEAAREAMLNWRCTHVVPIYYLFRSYIPSARVYIAEFRIEQPTTIEAEEDAVDTTMHLERMALTILSALLSIITADLVADVKVVNALSPLEQEELMAFANTVLTSSYLDACGEAARRLHRVLATATRARASSSVVSVDDGFVADRRETQFQHFVQFIAHDAVGIDGDVAGIHELVTAMLTSKHPSIIPDSRGVRSSIFMTPTSASALTAAVESKAGTSFVVDQLLQRLVEYGCNIPVGNEGELRIILQIVRSLLDRGKALKALSTVQQTMAQLGVARMLFSQLCRPWWQKDVPTFTQIVGTCCELLQGGNEAVQEILFQMMKAEADSFTSNLGLFLMHSFTGLRSLPLQMQLYHLRGFRDSQEESMVGSGAVRRSVSAVGPEAIAAASAAVAAEPPKSSHGHRMSVATKLMTMGADAVFGTTPAARSAAEGPAKADGLDPTVMGADDFLLLQSVFRLLQLFCEGHHSGLQNFLRDQRSTNVEEGVVTHATQSTNFVAMACQMLEIMHHRITAENAHMCLQVLDTLIEFVQGPCLENQLTLVSNKIVEILSRLLSLSVEDLEKLRIPISLAKMLQYRFLLVILSLFEGRQDHKLYQRIAALIELEPLKRVIVAVYADLHKFHDGRYEEAAFFQRFLVASERSGVGEFEDPKELARLGSQAMLETGCAAYMLVQQLADHVPSFQQELEAAASLALPQNSAQFLGITQLGAPDLTVFSAKATEHTFGEAWYFFATHCASVEIVRDGMLERFYFPVPPMCYHLTEPTKDAVKWGIDRDSPGKKLADFFNRHESLLEEMKHQQWLQAFFQRTRVLSTLNSAGHRWKSLSFLLAIAINLLIILCYHESGMWSVYETTVNAESATCDSHILGRDTNVNWHNVITVLGVFQTITSTLIVFFYYLNYGPLLWQQGLRKWRELGPASLFAPANWGKVSLRSLVMDSMPKNDTFRAETLQKAPTLQELLSVQHTMEMELERISRPFVFLMATLSLLRSFEFLYYSAYVIMTILGNSVHHFFFSFHLIDIVVRYEELRIVLQSVIRPLKPLLLTGVLFVVLQFFYTLVGFAWFPEYFGQNRCRTLFRCMWSTMDLGFKSDGGLGGGLPTTTHELDGLMWGVRIVYDNSYYILVMSVMLQLVFGIILDTFGDLRSLTKEKEEDMTSKCFICNIERALFDKAARNGFERHVKHEHYMWHYLYMIAYLKFKSPTELIGVEEYLLDKIKARDLSFFPVNRAMSLKPIQTKEDEFANNLVDVKNDLAWLRERLDARRRAKLT